MSTISIPQVNGLGTKFKLGELSTINNITLGPTKRTASEKAIISELTSLKAG
jgi:hypothetical protein